MAKQQQLSQLEHRQAVNKWAALIVPAILVGIVGYTTWVVVVLVGTHYLLNPGPGTNVSARPGAGIAIIVLYFVLLLPAALSYFRLLHTVLFNRGYTSPGEPSAATKTHFEPDQHIKLTLPCRPTSVSGEDELANVGKAEISGKIKKTDAPVLGETLATLDIEAIFSGDVLPPSGLDRFYSKDVFACDSNGLPIWCAVCCNWKPDRSHHCSDVGRCVMKLDHFCPWVGGVVGETNFKFFVQFNSYTALYTLYILIVMAYFVAEANSKSDHKPNVNWVVILALAALFFLFTCSMAGQSMQYILNNLTTIDSINRTRRTMYLAVLVYEDSLHQTPFVNQTVISSDDGVSIPAPVSSRPGSERNEQRLVQTHAWQGTITYPLLTKPSVSHSAPPPITRASRTFAILHTPPGTNPWDLGRFDNFKTVMGDKWYDWFVPLRYSPCCNHDRGDSLYQLGPAVEHLKRDAAIAPVSAPFAGSSHSHSREHRRKRGHSRRRSNGSLGSMQCTLGDVDGVANLGDVTRPRKVDISQV